MKQTINILLLGTLILSGCCSSANRRLDAALEFAGDNRSELEQVLEHYKDSGEKYNAARFLIENMPRYFSYEGERLDSVKAVKAEIIKKGFLTDEQKNKWKGFSPKELIRVYDAKVIKAAFLIDNIDLAFSVWKGKPWGRSVSFNDFCEFILPYRLADEPLENWRRTYYDRFSALLDSLYQGNDPVVATDSLYGALKKITWKYNLSFNLPALGATFLLNNPIGGCKEVSDFTVYVMRALGFPVAIDAYLYSPVNRYAHYWNVLQDTTGINIPFWLLDTKVQRGGTDGRKKGKVYRLCYGLQKEKLKGLFASEETPASLRNGYVKDVTHEYFGKNTSEIEVDSRLCGEFVYPAVFRKEGWYPVDVAEHHNGKATIRNIEPDVTFIPLSSKDRRVRAVGYPFQLTASGVRSFRPDQQKTERVTLRRKYALRRKIEASLKSVKGTCIEGSSTPTFQRAELLHTITSVPYPYMDNNVVSLCSAAPYRYIRYSSAPDEPIDMAELSFYTASAPDEKIEMKVYSASDIHLDKDRAKVAKMIDGEHLTYYTSAMKGANVIFDLGRPQSIKKMVYTPHTDGNFIYQGDEYELYYQNGAHGWVSLGRKTAVEAQLVYQNVPVNALLWLTNLSRVRDEQVFYIEDGEQVFVLNDK